MLHYALGNERINVKKETIFSDKEYWKFRYKLSLHNDVKQPQNELSALSVSSVDPYKNRS